MLQSLHIRNLALVAALDVEFGSGLNTVTGETGAGKSLILGALQYLLGDRADKSMIRQGEDRCDIAACISIPAHFAQLQAEVDHLLEDFGVTPCDNNLLTLKRSITAGGSRAFINNTPVTLQTLRAVGALLVDMHGPHEHQTLTQPSQQRRLLDAFADLGVKRAACHDCFDRKRRLQHELEVLRQQHISADEVKFLRQQLAEIEAAELNPELDVDLDSQYNRASRSRELIMLAQQCCQGLTEADGAIVDQSSRMVRLLDELSSIDTENGPVYLERLEQAIRSMQELSYDLANYADNQDLDAEELQRLEARINLVQKLKRRHGTTLNDILTAADSLRMRLDAVEEHGLKITELEQSRRDLEKRHLLLCRELTEKRRQAAVQLAREIALKLKSLDFAQAEFRIELHAAEPGPEGADQVEFICAPNPGEPPRPLREIASSGEMSRVMLAVKTVLSAADNIPILIFDEVDANIGGRVAVTVAEELQSVAQRHQVFCITHLPQIAAAGHQHFTVAKQIVEGRTITAMKVLTESEREAEVIRMLGAPDESDTAARHAREMLQKFATAELNPAGQKL